MLAYGIFFFLSIYPFLAKTETVYTDVDAGITEEIPAEEVYQRRYCIQSSLWMMGWTADCQQEECVPS